MTTTTISTTTATAQPGSVSIPIQEKKISLTNVGKAADLTDKKFDKKFRNIFFWMKICYHFPLIESQLFEKTLHFLAQGGCYHL